MVLVSILLVNEPDLESRIAAVGPGGSGPQQPKAPGAIPRGLCDGCCFEGGYFSSSILRLCTSPALTNR